MLECLIVGAGGAVGAILRHLVGMVPLTPENGFPVKTFLINVIGLLLSASWQHLPPNIP